MSRARDQLIELARRKERLIARAEAQRTAVVASFRSLQGPIGIVDRGVDIARFLRGHPLLVTAIVATFTVFRRRGLLSMAGRALSVWRVWRAVAAWVA
jgi:hypothetical protein